MSRSGIITLSARREWAATVPYTSVNTSDSTYAANPRESERSVYPGNARGSRLIATASRIGACQRCARATTPAIKAKSTAARATSIHGEPGAASSGAGLAVRPARTNGSGIAGIMGYASAHIRDVNPDGSGHEKAGWQLSAVRSQPVGDGGPLRSEWLSKSPRGSEMLLP